MRLLYVAMTRAERELRISYAEQRTFNGRVVDRRPSPLLDPLLRGAGRGAVRVTSRRAPMTTTGPSGRTSWPGSVPRSRRARRRVTAELEALRAWRDVAARAARIEPEAVLPDHVLARVAAARPRDVEALGAIRGVGPILAQRFGEAILDALAGRATWHEVRDRAAVRRRRRRGGAGLRRPRPVRRARRPAEALPARRARPRGRRRRRRAPGALPLQRRALAGRPRRDRPCPAHVGGALHARPPRPHGHASRWCPTTTATGSAARARTGSRRSTTARAAVTARPSSR